MDTGGEVNTYWVAQTCSSRSAACQIAWEGTASRPPTVGRVVLALPAGGVYTDSHVSTTRVNDMNNALQRHRELRRSRRLWKQRSAPRPATDNRQLTNGIQPYYFFSSSSGGGACCSAFSFSAAFCLASALLARFSASFCRTSEPTNSSTAKSAPSPFRQPVRTIRV